MTLFGFLRPEARISDGHALRGFLDRRSAFMVQKSVFEYSRARSGLLSSKLFKEPAFVAAADEARWRNYPLCLEIHAVMAEHALRPHAGSEAEAVRRALCGTATAICATYPVPKGFDAGFWRLAAERIERRIVRSGLGGLRPVKDIPHEIAEEFFRNMPIHDDLRSFDFELITNNLRVNLCRAHDDLLATADLPALSQAMILLARDVVGPEAAPLRRSAE
jgi:hypothetical protein